MNNILNRHKLIKITKTILEILFYIGNYKSNSNKKTRKPTNK